MPEYLFEKNKVKEHQRAMQARVEKLVRPVKDKSEWEKEKYGKKARVRIGCMYVLCIFLNFTAIRNIAITVGVTNLTVGGCVIAGKIKNIVFKQRGGKLL